MKRNLKCLVWLILVTAFLVEASEVYAQNSVPYTPASLFIWTDKYVYQPGDPIIVRLTARGNGDGNLYTAVLYRQNNQTGAKTYMSATGASGTAVDISGRTPEQGMTQYVLGDVTKFVIIGAGGWAPADTAPGELGMHTIALEIRDATGSRIVKTAYAKIGVVNGFDPITGDITTDRTLVNTRAYDLSGTVIVKNNATLTIQPGTFIFGQPGSLPASALIIGTTGRIMAEGTRSRPITMTSSRQIPFGQREAGNWGGLVLLGKAQTNVTGGVGNIEGLPPSADTTYGGTDNTHNCGTLAYVRVEFAGAVIGANNELNGITWGGCGSRTVSHHLQVRYGIDDAFEWFGGTNDAKYVAAQNAKDDYLDGQLGWSGRVQHGVMLAGTDTQGNRGIEMDNSEFDDRAAPQGKPQLYNITFVGSGDLFNTGSDEPDSAAVWLRRGSGGAYNNLLLFNWIVNGVRILENAGSTATADSIGRGDLSMNGILMWDNGKSSGRSNDVAGQAANFGTTNNNQLARDLLNGTLGNGRNVLVTDPVLRRPLYRSDPDFLPRAGSPVFRANWVQPPDDGFFDQSARWNGGFGDVDWTEEWTVWPQEADLRP